MVQNCVGSANAYLAAAVLCLLELLLVCLLLLLRHLLELSLLGLDLIDHNKSISLTTHIRMRTIKTKNMNSAGPCVLETGCVCHLAS